MDHYAQRRRFPTEVAQSLGQRVPLPAHVAPTLVLAAPVEQISEAAPVAVGTGPTLIVGKDRERRGLRVRNAGTADVYIGGAGVSVNNAVILLKANEVWEEGLAAAAAWYAVSATSGTVTVQELR